MSYAVVKFTDEAHSDEEIVQEVPVSWLVKDNTFCKWPSDKFSSIYITKGFPPQDNWNEYPVEVEHICASLADAKKIMKETPSEMMGRGFRSSKPTDYFSPAEEEVKQKKKLIRKGISGSSKSESQLNEIQFHYEFLDDLNLEENLAGNSRKTSELSVQEESDVQKEKPTNVDVPEVDVSDIRLGSGTKVIDVPGSCTEVINLQSVSNVLNLPMGTKIYSQPLQKTTGSGPGCTEVTELDMVLIKKDLESIFQLLAQLKLDSDEIKQRLDEITPSFKGALEDSKLPINLPVKTLEQLAELEEWLNTSQENKRTMINYLKKIGGNDHKDFITRLSRAILSNVVAEACSLTGRKNNYPIGDKQFTKIMFDVVHHKTKCTQKAFEITLSEWLRHAKQRRIREGDGTPN